MKPIVGYYGPAALHLLSAVGHRGIEPRTSSIHQPSRRNGIRTRNLLHVTQTRSRCAIRLNIFDLQPQHGNVHKEDRISLILQKEEYATYEQLT